MVKDSLVFVLPSGRSAKVAPRPARLIYERLWDLGVGAGVATAAARISDALRSNPSLRADVVFSERELLPLLDAAKAHPPTWARLTDPGTLDTISLDERRRLVARCLELLEGFSGEYEGEKPRALIDDLERLRDRLWAMTARELLREAGDRVASGLSQGADARAVDGCPVDVLDPDAASWSLLGALQGAAFAGPEAQVEEIRLAVAAIAELIADPSLTHWNDRSERTSQEVHTVLARAEALTTQAACSGADGSEAADAADPPVCASGRALTRQRRM
jgi:hypothetical protein